MSAQKPSTDDEKLTSLLLGQLPPEETERLATEMLDNSQVTPAAEKLPDDTLLASVKQATVSADAEADKLAGRLVERLKPEGEETTAAYPEADEDAEPMPAELEYYRVEKEIGRGGMGMVYLARDTRLNRPVAIKTLRADLAKKPSAKERFLREARVAAALEHESVVPIYYVGEAGGIPFLAMPVLKGQGLDAHLKANGGRLSPAEVIRIASQIAGGLAAAHAVGLIHRDIKPSNVWVDADGRRVRVLDFGLARYEADESHLTVSGMIVGTPAYMAPEQARGRGIDARADLFSLGVVMYQMLTGRRPFTGTDTVSIISSLALDTPPAPHVVNFDVPSELSDLVMRLLEKEPQNRPASATVVRVALDTLAIAPTEDRTELDFSPPTPPHRQPKSLPKVGRKFPLAPLLVALGLLIVIGGGVAAVYQFVFSTKDGTLVVEVDEAADVRFKNGKLQVYDEKGELKYTVEPGEKNKGLPPGKYSVKVVGADGVKLDTDKFEIEKNGKVLVKVTASGPKDVAAVDPKKPDPLKPDPVKPGVPGGGLLVFVGESGEGRAHAPAPGLDVAKSWTAEAYFTPLTEHFAKTHCQVVGCDSGFGLGVKDGKYFVYSTHTDTFAGVVKAGERVHIACVQTETKLLMFLNGKLVGSKDNPFPVEKKPVGALHISVENHVHDRPPVEVLVDGVRVSQTARYTKDFTPPGRHTADKETLALYHCDEGSGDKLTDSSGNNHHGKITNAKWGKASTVTVPPTVPGTPLALRKATWKPGPADNILPGLAARPAILDGFGRWQIVPTSPRIEWNPVVFSPDGKWVATADFAYVRIYDAATGEFKALGKRTGGAQPHAAVLGLDWSPDSKWVRVADFRGAVFSNGDLFATDGTRSPVPYIQHANPDFGWNPKFPVFACVTQGDSIQIIDPTQAKPVEIAAKPGGNGKAVWSPDGETLLVVREGRTAQLFGRDGKPGAHLADVVDPVATPAWSADGSQIAAMVNANEIGFWMKDGTAGAKTAKHEKPVLALHWNPDGKRVAVSDAEGKRHFWKTDGTTEGVADTKDATPGFVWAKDGKGFFTPGKFWPAVGNPSFTNFVTGREMAAIPSPDQRSVALAKRGEIAVHELKDGEAKDIGWKIAQSNDGQPAWSADGQRLAVSDATGVALYDARDPKKVVRLGGGAVVYGLNRAAFSAKGDRLAVGNSFGSVTVCEPTGKVLRAISLPTPVEGAPDWAVLQSRMVHDLQWHPDGRHLAVTTGGATVIVFDTETGKVEATAVVQGARPGGSAVFSPANPDHLVIAHPDASALWRWKVEKEPIQKFDGLGKLIPSPDGKRILSLQAGGAHHGNDFIPAALVSPDLKDRDTAGTKEYITHNGHPGASLAWHPDGKHLVVTRLTHGSNAITTRSLDGKVVEEIKPDGIDVTWLEWVSPLARRNVLVGRIGQGPDVCLFDLSAKKLTPFGKVSGELSVSPDGKHLIAMEESVLTYWNLDTKAVDQKVVLLPNGEFVTLSLAGEVLEKSANAGNYYRYLVEDKTGKLLLKTPAEMAPSLPKSEGTPVGIGPQWPLDPTPPDEIKFFLAHHVELTVRDAKGDVKLGRDDAVPDRPVTVVGANFWGSDLHVAKMDDAWMRRFAKLTDLEDVNFNFSGAGDPAATTAGSREFGALVNLRKFSFGSRVKGGFDVSVLEKMTQLEELYLVSMPGSDWLKNAVGLKTLRRIVMEFGSLSDAELEQLAGLPRLSFVSLSGPTPAAFQAFAKKLPWCRIKYAVEGQEKIIEPTALAPLDPEWAKAVAALPPEKQVEAVRAELRKRNHESDGQGGQNKHTIEGGAVVALELDGKLTDLTPLQALHALKALSVQHVVNENAAAFPLTDLTPLRGLKLTALELRYAQVTDLSPLKGMPLQRLSLFGVPVTDVTELTGMPLEVLVLRETGVADLTPLKGMKLRHLVLYGTQVKDLAPLAGMPLESLDTSNLVSDLSPLKGMALKSLHCDGRVVSDLSPLKGMPLEELWCVGPKVTDLTPLEGMPLQRLRYDENLERDGKTLRSLISLEMLNERPAKDVLK